MIPLQITTKKKHLTTGVINQQKMMKNKKKQKHNDPMTGRLKVTKQTVIMVV